jgi:DNA-binding NarL/FixJ family response regulator
VFLLDDHEIVRRGIAQLLETDDDIEAGNRPPLRVDGLLGAARQL